MNQFSPANLSPVPIAPVPCDLPFDLTWHDLRPCLAKWDGREEGVQSLKSYEKQGLHKGSNSCILTLRYADIDHNQREATVFIKRSDQLHDAEAARYDFLTSRGVPVARLLAASQRADHEVIVLEFLATIGIEFTSTSHVTDLLELIARLNATVTSIDQFQPLPGRPREEFNASVRAALAELARTSPDIDADVWFKAYQSVHKAVSAMPTALNHGEFSYQQVGWAQRGSTNVLVMFDLATMAHRPRYFDIANILQSLAQESGSQEMDLFDFYLRSLDRFGGIVKQSGRDALHELRLTRACGNIQALPWLVHAAPDTTGFDLGNVLAGTVRTLTSDLAALGYAEP